MLFDTSRSTLAFVIVAIGAAFTTGCAEAYFPKPSPRIAVVQDGNSVTLVKDGKGSGVGVFGGGLEDAVRGNPRAEAEAESYASKSTGAFVCSMLGIGTAVSGGIMLGVDAANSNDVNKFPTALGWGGLGLLVGSAVFNIVSGSLHGSAQTNLFNAINIYNDGLEQRGPYVPYPTPYGAPIPAPGYRPLPSFQGPQPGYLPPPPAAPPGVPPGLVPSPPPGAPGAPPGGAFAPTPAPLPPGALPPPGTQPVPLGH